MLQSRDDVVLEVEQTEPVFSLQDGADGEVPAIQVQPVWVDGSLLWRPVDDWDPRSHGRLGKDEVVFGRAATAGVTHVLRGRGTALLGARQTALGHGCRRETLFPAPRLSAREELCRGGVQCACQQLL